MTLGLFTTCSPPTEDPNLDDQGIYRATLAALSDSLGIPLLVLPTAGGSDLELRAAYDSLAAEYLPAEHPDLPMALLVAGREVNEEGATVGPLPLPGVHLLSSDDERTFLDSRGVAWERLRARFGNEAQTVQFARPAISESGQEALLYYYCSALYPMGGASAYAYLLRQSDGTWTLSWLTLWEIE